MAMTRRKSESDLDYAKRRLAEAERIKQDRANEIKRLQRTLGHTTKQLEKTEELLGTVSKIRKRDLTIPKWANKIPKTKTHIARPVLLLSDLHLDEVVDLDTMGGVNSYNREIAEQRLERVIDKALEQLTRYWSGYEYDGITLMLGGDIITGDIHEELADTNEATIPATIAHWTPILASIIDHLADQFGRIWIASVDGNHDRIPKKPRMKLRAQNSWMWLIGAWLADKFEGDDRVNFTMSESSEQIIPIYNYNALLVHGDGAKGGAGWAGPVMPIARYVKKTMDFYQSVGTNIDAVFMGHWHSSIVGPGGQFYVNGSTKGYDEYANRMKFGYELPSQTLFLVTPERGLTQRAILWAEDKPG